LRRNPFIGSATIKLQFYKRQGFNKFIRLSHFKTGFIINQKDNAQVTSLPNSEVYLYEK